MFRKALFVLSATILAVAIPAGARADSSLLDYQSAVDALAAVDPTIDPPPNDPGTDFAVGGLQGPDENNNIGFSAHGGPFGEDPQGHMSETIPAPENFKARFRVTCLAVAGNEAAIGLVPTDASSNDQVNEFVFAVFDSGLPGGTGDLFSFVPLPADLCAGGLGQAAFAPDRGNIHVHDALP
jgi:hypothetical protein